MPEKWDPYNISLTDDLIDLIRSWVVPLFEDICAKITQFLDRVLGE